MSQTMSKLYLHPGKLNSDCFKCHQHCIVKANQRINVICKEMHFKTKDLITTITRYALLQCSAQSRLASFKLFFSQFFRGVGDGVTPRISLPLAIWKGLKSFCVGGGRQVGSRCKPNLVFNFCPLVKLNNLNFHSFQKIIENS